MQQRQNKTAFMKITKKHDTTKIGCGEFPTKIKNEKKKVHFLNTIIIQTHMKFQPSFFLYMGNTVKLNLQE